MLETKPSPFGMNARHSPTDRDDRNAVDTKNASAMLVSNRERRMNTIDYDFEIKSLAETGQFEGLAAGYGNIDSYDESFATGAFAKSLAAHRDAGTMPALLAHHNLAKPIGRWTDLREHPTGLIATGKLTLDSSAGREAYALVKDKALRGLSVGFRTKAATRDGQGRRVITDAVLYEISLVSIPANPSTWVSSVKSIQSVRDLEDVLHEHGFSNRKARTAAAAAWRAINDEANSEAAAIAWLREKSNDFLKGPRNV